MSEAIPMPPPTPGAGTADPTRQNIAAGFQGMAGVASAAGSMMAASAAQTTGAYNSAADLVAGQNAMAAANANAALVQNRVQRSLGQTQADYGAAGVAMQGSPLQVMQDAAVQGELSRQLTLYQGQIAQQNYQQRAAMDQFSASQIATADQTKAYGTLLTTAGSAASRSGFALAAS